MRLQVFSQYYQLAEEGKVPYLSCPMHKDDLSAVFPLLHSMDEVNLKVMLQCKGCGYQQTAGLDLYNAILRRILGIEK